jgi:hypothetical protein
LASGRSANALGKTIKDVLDKDADTRLQRG